MGIERGCGVREPGGIYFQVLLSKRGRPIEEFLFDPPLPVGDLAVPDRGVLILERPDGSGIHDVYDRVGESGYPNVADMIEEIRRFGLSRRAGKSLDFSQLGPGSMIFLLHPRAIVRNVATLYAMLREEWQDNRDAAHEFRCPCNRKHHALFHPDARLMLSDQTCAGVWWETLRKAEPVYDLSAPRRSCTRRSGSTTYAGRHAPHGFRGEYETGIFARFPISNIAVVADPEGGQDAVAHTRLESTGLPVVDVND
jgi:hypothetical protein